MLLEEDILPPITSPGFLAGEVLRTTASVIASQQGFGHSEHLI